MVENFKDFSIVMLEKKIYREFEVIGKKDKFMWLIIYDNVYDVIKFLEEVSNKLIIL